MSRIRILLEQVANKIAAGVVAERAIRRWLQGLKPQRKGELLMSDLKVRPPKVRDIL